MNRLGASILGFCIVLAAAAGVAAGDIDTIRLTVHSWRDDWQRCDLNRYMTHYHSDFQAKGLNRDQWRSRKQYLCKHDSPLSIKVSDLWVVMDKERAVARFLQHYQSRRLTETGEKTLVLVKAQGRWQIFREQWRALASPGSSRDRSPEKNAQPDPVTKTPEPMADAPLRVETEPDADRLYLSLGQFFIPMVSTIDQGKPRVVIDIQGVSHWEGKSEQRVDGTWIQNIRSYLHQGEPNKLRIVLDLTTDRSLILNQTYFGEKNVFCLEITKAKDDSESPVPIAKENGNS